MGFPELVNPASLRLLTVEQAKLHCRCQHDLENDSFSDWIKTAEAYCQDYTRSALLTSTWTLTLEEFPEEDEPIDLLISPVQAIVSVTYFDQSGLEQTLDPDDYQLAKGLVPKLYPGVGTLLWPETEEDNISSITITMTAGYASIALVPAQFSQAMKLLIGEWYIHRDTSTIPEAVDCLLDQVISERYR